MSVANAIFNVAALAFSFIAVVISAISARWQTIEARRANVMLFMTEMGSRDKGREFRKAEEYILTQLSQFDPALGVYGLPEPACDYAVLVCRFYQDIGALVVTGVIEEDLAVAMYYSGLTEVWRALEPYIRAEREIRRARGIGSIFGSYEHLAVYAASVSHDQVRDRFLRRKFPEKAVNADGAADLATASGNVSQTDSPAGG